ncbi:hypothetical protein OPT61_g3277 [Boeremia exigua]|uniref:Uncharacterized protein n=1 Tax=Boeremia exigua TaxID=749465 RepID=A0ACC2III1_9PLEO|nr:hypothetical protein OPT61_g3277 [Boeremia exigua]
MPADRVQKSRGSGDVPDLGNPDRKRMLNVLAQRRYRQRRKEKIASLEAQAKDPNRLIDHQSTISNDASPSAGSASDQSDRIGEFIDVPCENETSFIVHGNPFDTTLIGDLDPFLALPTPLSSTPELADPQYGASPSGFAFPLTADGGTLTMPVMNLVQTLFSIATAFNLNEKLWDPFYMHVMPAYGSYPTSLPANLHPVSVQFTIPHHPAIDLLPWPSVREKLIILFAMPNRLRPSIAQEDDDGGSNAPGIWLSSGPTGGGLPPGQGKAVSRLIQDIDDFQDGGGLMVHGNSVAWGQGNEFVEEAWEVGESFYRNWWFCLDQKIIDQSNKRRNERGLGRLRLAA